MPKTPKKKKIKNLSYTATAARANLYSILREASTSYQTYEITQRQADPVVVMSKEKYEKLMQLVPAKELDNLSRDAKDDSDWEKKVKYPETLAVIKEWSAKANPKADFRKMPSRDEIYSEYLTKKMGFEV